jgi:riboflavin kinase/FMN adenylyltransferase
VNVARSVEGIERCSRAVAIGTFDGVHRGHQRVIGAAVDSGLVPTVVTFDPHPRIALGYGVELLTTLERRLELIAGLGVADTLVVHFDHALQQREAEDFARDVLGGIGAEIVVAGETFRFGHRRRGDLELLQGLGFDARAVPFLEGVSSTEIRRLLQEGDVAAAAELLGRATEVEGTVVVGDERGGTLGFPTANLAVDAQLLVPAYGIYAGTAREARAAISIGMNPHYGGRERKIEAFLLDFEGDLYGQRLVVELWQRLRDEQVFESEQALIDQIARDVEATRQAVRPG